MLLCLWVLCLAILEMALPWLHAYFPRLLSVCFHSYNDSNYSRILIGSHLWSIRGHMHNWRHHYKIQFSLMDCRHTRLPPRVPLLCSYHILTSSVVYYWTDARQHGIYLLSREMTDIFQGIMPQHSTQGHIYGFLSTPVKCNLRWSILFSVKKKNAWSLYKRSFPATVFITGVPSSWKDLTRKERDTSSLERERNDDLIIYITSFFSLQAVHNNEISNKIKSSD